MVSIDLGRALEVWGLVCLVRVIILCLLSVTINELIDFTSRTVAPGSLRRFPASLLPRLMGPQLYACWTLKITQQVTGVVFRVLSTLASVGCVVLTCSWVAQVQPPILYPPKNRRRHQGHGCQAHRVSHPRKAWLRAGV